MAFKDLTGMRFGRLVVLSLSDKREKGSNCVRRCWNCRCDCGNETIATTKNLTSMRTQSCGCRKREIASITATKVHTKHNMTKEYRRQYNILKGIVQRCTNPNFPQYHNYGGKGVTICEEWRNDPIAFVKWWLSQSSDANAKLDVDRIDPNGNYEPSNCQLITRAENSARNTDMWFTVNGIKKTCAEWSRILKRGHGYLQRIWRRDGESFAYERLVFELNNIGYGI